MQPLGETLCSLHAKAVDEELLGELSFALQALDHVCHLRPYRHTLQGDDIPFARIERTVEIGEADAIVTRLARESEALELLLGIVGIENHQLIAVGVAGEVAEPGSRIKVVLLTPHTLEARGEALVLAVALDK